MKLEELVGKKAIRTKPVMRKKYNNWSFMGSQGPYEEENRSFMDYETHIVHVKDGIFYYISILDKKRVSTASLFEYDDGNWVESEVSKLEDELNLKTKVQAEAQEKSRE